MKVAAATIAAMALALPGATGADTATTAQSIGFICSAEQHIFHPGARRIEIETGYGDGGFPIATKRPEAQNWFNFGIVLFHAFYHDDAKLAFDKAVAADPDCAMCLWGQALSRGPTQNFDVSADQLKDALVMAKKAQGLAKSPLEHALADAMVARDSSPQNVKTERDFAAALQAAGAADPSYTDLPLIAAEALLTASRRKDKSAARDAMAIIEPILKQEPNNTAAIHYYIHATEFAKEPALALPYAERLAALAPKASHLVHMASHTFLDVGRYEDAAAVNARALDVDTEHADATGVAGPLGTPFYYGHNFTFGLAGAMMAGDGPLALKFADHAPKAFPGGGSQLGRTMAAYGRFAPDRALALAAPPKTETYRTYMWLYARGEAYAARGDAANTLVQSRLITTALGPKPADDSPATQARIAVKVLEGRAAMIQGRAEDAANSFKDAADLQAKADWGKDPPPWWYPVRRSLAAADLKAGRLVDARREAQASLTAFPNDALALRVLGEAEAKLGNARSAQDDLAKARGAWHGDLDKVPLDLT